MAEPGAGETESVISRITRGLFGRRQAVSEAVYEPKPIVHKYTAEELGSKNDPDILLNNILRAGASEPRSSGNPQEFAQAKAAILKMGRDIFQNAISVEHQVLPTEWGDSDAGVEATSRNTLKIEYTDGFHGTLVWNPGDIVETFPRVSVEAEGRVRDILSKDYPEVKLDGPVSNSSEVFHPLPKMPSLMGNHGSAASRISTTSIHQPPNITTFIK